MYTSIFPLKAYVHNQNAAYNYYSVKGIILRYTTKPERSLFISQSFDYFFISLTCWERKKKHEINKKKKKVWARVQMKQTSSLIGWIFFIETVIGPVLDRLSEMNSRNAPWNEKAALWVYILPTALFENYWEKRF